MRKLHTIAATAALFTAAPSFAATTIIPQDNSAPGPTLEFTNGSATATFGASYSVDNTSFTDTFFFTLAQVATLTAGQLETNAGGNSAPFSRDLDISVVDLLSGATTVFTFSKSTSPSGTDKNELFVVPNSFMNTSFGAGTYSLRLTGIADNVGSGNNTGTYNGSLSFAATSAVPEPTTWAMMLVGFGAVGYSMRSRKAARPNAQLV